MRITNTLPERLDAFGSYAIEVEGIETDTINVLFEGGIEDTTIPYAVHKGKASIRLDSIIQSMMSDDAVISSLYSNASYPRDLYVSIVGSDISKDFLVYYSALPFGNGKTLDDYVGKRLGYIEKSPLFVGYPKRTSVLKGYEIQHISNNEAPEFISNQYEECGGVYLVWRNPLGGWSDHLFFKTYERKITAKEIGEVQRYTNNRATGVTLRASLGVEATEEWALKNEIPWESEDHKREVESILLSNEVYLYTAEQYSNELKFIQVKVKTQSNKTKVNALTYDEFEVTIELPPINTIKL